MQLLHEGQRVGQVLDQVKGPDLNHRITGKRKRSRGTSVEISDYVDPVIALNIHIHPA